ncbi:MAG: AsnC family transcriptional regulator [Rhizobiales bacterium]|nr:AsnC family transcriptional regulator [Hyphomicrobiales bacterium]
MARARPGDGTEVPLDETDIEILKVLQRDSTLPLERLAKRVGISKTAVWNRIQRLQSEKVIRRQAVIVDAQRAGLGETFFIAIRTSQHNAGWLEAFHRIVQDMPEIMEAHRMAGEIDYILKVQVRSTRAFDDFYKRLVAQIDLFNVTSMLSMEVLKQETALPL